MRPLIQTGNTLANGALVLAVADDYVLAAVDKGENRVEYVTWGLSAIDGATYSGHYFNADFFSAVADLAKRAEWTDVYTLTTRIVTSE